MKAISLWQPYATLIAIGAKQYETRSWETKHRGPIAIHAAKHWTLRDALVCYQEPFFSVLTDAGIVMPAKCNSIDLANFLPLGCVVAVAELTNCIRMTGAVCLTSQEHAFGDWTERRFAWKLENVIRWASPMPWAGAQSLFTIPDQAMRDHVLNINY